MTVMMTSPSNSYHHSVCGGGGGGSSMTTIPRLTTTPSFPIPDPSTATANATEAAAAAAAAAAARGSNSSGLSFVPHRRRYSGPSLTSSSSSSSSNATNISRRKHRLTRRTYNNSNDYNCHMDTTNDSSNVVAAGSHYHDDVNNARYHRAVAFMQHFRRLHSLDIIDEHEDDFTMTKTKSMKRSETTSCLTSLVVDLEEDDDEEPHDGGGGYGGEDSNHAAAPVSVSRYNFKNKRSRHLSFVEDDYVGDIDSIVEEERHDEDDDHYQHHEHHDNE